jgi:hypothetical protein
MNFVVRKSICLPFSNTTGNVSTKIAYHFRSNIPGVQSVFEGYNYKLLNNPNYDLIHVFLNHIKTYWCDNDDKIYNYIINWFSFIIKYDGKKTLTALVVQGSPGCGKNVVGNTIAKLTAPYSTANISNISDITGQFNSLIENKVFAVCNELKSDKDNKLVDTNQLKTLMTEDNFVLNEKFVKKRVAKNVCNFAFITNNMAPFKVDIYLYGHRCHPIPRIIK